MAHHGRAERSDIGDADAVVDCLEGIAEVGIGAGLVAFLVEDIDFLQQTFGSALWWRLEQENCVDLRGDG